MAGPKVRAVTPESLTVRSDAPQPDATTLSDPNPHPHPLSDGHPFSDGHPHAPSVTRLSDSDALALMPRGPARAGPTSE